MVPVKNGKIEIGDIKYSGEYQSSRELSSRGSRAWVVFPATFHFFPLLSLSLSFSFHPLASIDPRPFLFVQFEAHSRNNFIFHNQVGDTGTTDGAGPLPPPTHPVPRRMFRN